MTYIRHVGGTVCSFSSPARIEHDNDYWPERWNRQVMGSDSDHCMAKIALWLFAQRGKFFILNQFGVWMAPSRPELGPRSMGEDDVSAA